MQSISILIALGASALAVYLSILDMGRPLAASLVHAWDSSFFLYLAAEVETDFRN